MNDEDLKTVPHRILDLGGSHWQLGRAPAGSDPTGATWQELDRVAEWLPATVPGNVRADLVRAGRLPDLDRAAAVESARWVDDFSWWLVRDFDLSLAPGGRAHIFLRGVDYVSDLFLNGHRLGHHEGMFSPQQHEITALLRPQNRLAVRITGSRWLPEDRSTAWEKLLNRIEARIGGLAPQFPHRRDTLKCQMGFGWDFAPPLRTMGIWDDVYIVVSREVSIREVWAQQKWSGDELALAIQIHLDARRACDLALRCTLAGETFQSAPIALERPVELVPGANTLTVELPVPAPQLWWPWDHGRPDLYRLTVEARDGDRLLDSTGQSIGLRRLEWRDWTLHVNGRPVYARGANWVPAGVLPGQVGPDDYRELLALARRANMNMLRVWGGGLREKRTFYDLCDRLGILVWQEFPFACAFFTRYPRSPDYLRLAEAEAGAIVRNLRHHPSLALWCGGNEFSPRRNAPLLAALQRAVVAADPDRLFLPASPAGGDSHDWRVWHGFWPSAGYLDDAADFASEFGLQAPPTVAALRRFIPKEDLWPPGPSWRRHGAGLQKLWYYARPFLDGERPDLRAFVEASRRAQAHGLGIAIEHYRRRKAHGCGGLLVWQLNEPWPAISWSLLDFFRRPKPAYETVERLFSPILVSVEYPLRRLQPGDPFRGRVWVVNDLPDPLPGCHLEVKLWTRDGQLAHHLERTLDVPPCCAQAVDDLDWVLPAGGGWHLTCRLAGQGQTLSANRYDLALHDGRKPPLSQVLWARFKDHLLRA